MKKILSILLILVGFVMAQSFGDLISNSDVKHEADDYSATFELLKQAEELEANNFEVIWRLARAHF